MSDPVAALRTDRLYRLARRQYGRTTEAKVLLALNYLGVALAAGAIGQATHAVRLAVVVAFILGVVLGSACSLARILRADRYARRVSRAYVAVHRAVAP